MDASPSGDAPLPALDAPALDTPALDTPALDVAADVVDSGTADRAPPPADVPADGGPRCALALDCDDHEACTADRCTGGVCRHDALADGVDCQGTAPGACVAGVCSVGAELRPPWRSSACTLWTRVPPQQDYLAPLATAEGVFAPSMNWLMIMHHAATWTMARMPPPDLMANSGFVALVAGSGWIAAVGNHRAPSGFDASGLGAVVVRQGGRWVDVTPEPLRSLQLAGAWTTGSVLYVSTLYGRVFAREGTAWRELAGASGQDGFGTPTALYLLNRNTSGATSLYRYDGVRATAVATPRIGEIRALGGVSPAEVYALGDRLYTVTGTTLAPAANVDCGAGVAPGFAGYERIADAPGQLAVVALCAGARRAFRRVGGAWAPAGTLPADLGATTYQIAISEDGSLHLTDAGRLWQYAAGAWAPLPEEAPALPSRPGFNTPVGSVSIVGGSYGSVSALGPRWARLVGDRWVEQMLPAGLSVGTAWTAPDGTIFAVSEGTLSGVWRLSAGTWTRDVPFARPLPHSNIIGRSSSDVYVAFGASTEEQVRHWDGTAWQTVPAPCPDFEGTPFSVDRLALAGPSTLIARCNSGPRVNYSPYQRDGDAGWRPVLPPSPVPRFGFLETLGPAATPSAIMGLNSPGGFQVRTAAGWVEQMFPAPDTGTDTTGNYYTFSVVPGSPANPLVTVGGAGSAFARTDGVTWTPFADWLTPTAITGPNAWTDGRWVILPAWLPTNAFSIAASEDIQTQRAGILRCDLDATR